MAAALDTGIDGLVIGAGFAAGDRLTEELLLKAHEPARTPWTIGTFFFSLLALMVFTLLGPGWIEGIGTTLFKPDLILLC